MTKINHTHPSLVEFKKNETKTLAYIYTRGLLNTFPELWQAVELAHFHYKGKTAKQLGKAEFTFHSDFDFLVEGKSHKVIVGAQVTGETHYELCTYFLAICGKDDRKLDLIRKFHFDYANPTKTPNQPVPIFHLQYGGKLSDEMVEKRITANSIETWLSLPRLNFAPTNLALLLDIFLCEFQTPETNAIVQDEFWRDLIKTNEEFLIKGYYSSVAAHIESDSYSKNKLVRDFFYGN